MVVMVSFINTRDYIAAAGFLERRGYNARMSNPASDGFYMPAEWSPHAACWMGWPCRSETFADLPQARAAYVDTARAISEFEKVWMIARAQDATDARRALEGVAEVLEWPADDSWLRDSGPTFLVNSTGDLAGVDWQFNAWGRKYSPFDSDDQIAARVLQHAQARRYAAPLVMEGGSFHADGEGTILTTEQCLLNANRNPSLSRLQIEDELKKHLGAKHIIWLAGDLRDAETDGHVDNVACFAAPGVVLAMEDGDDKMLKENIRRLHESQDANGRQLQVLTLPRPAVRENGCELPASYINFYFANDGIVMPSFELPREDDRARAVIAELFPRRKVVQVPARAIVRGGGGIHCITQQQPSG